MEHGTPDIYGGKDPGDVAAYGIAEAARYLKIPRTTLGSWVAGRRYPQRKPRVFSPLIITPENNDARRAFGRPIIFRRSISIAAIVDRVDAGESILR